MFPRKQCAPFSSTRRPSGRVKMNSPSSVRGQAIAAFVHEPMVKAAERDQVAELRLAAVGPVLHVMTFGEARPIAAGVTAAAVARFQRTADRGGMLRVLRPMSSGSPSSPSTRPTIVASHASRRAVSSASAGPSSSSDRWRGYSHVDLWPSKKATDAVPDGSEASHSSRRRAWSQSRFDRGKQLSRRRFQDVVDVRRVDTVIALQNPNYSPLLAPPMRVLHTEPHGSAFSRPTSTPPSPPSPTPPAVASSISSHAATPPSPTSPTSSK